MRLIPFAWATGERRHTRVGSRTFSVLRLSALLSLSFLGLKKTVKVKNKKEKKLFKHLVGHIMTECFIFQSS